MTITVQKSNRLEWAIVIDEAELRRLDEVIRLSFTSSENEEYKLEYSIQCSDGSVIQVKEISDVIQENNSKEARIDSISAYAIGRSKRIVLTLGDRSGSESIHYLVTGNSRDWVSLTTSKLCDRFKNMKQWYTPISKVDWRMPTIVIAFILYIYADSLEKVESATSTSFVESIAAIFLLFSVVYLIPTILNKLSKYLFPSYIFSIGDGIKNHENLKSLRGQVLAITVAVTVGIFVNYLFI